MRLSDLIFNRKPVPAQFSARAKKVVDLKFAGDHRSKRHLRWVQGALTIPNGFEERRGHRSCPASNNKRTGSKAMLGVLRSNGPFLSELKAIEQSRSILKSRRCFLGR